ncbi:IMP 5'-nucleotidase [Blyttiomyces sp. JEL0837]|nr:IMP 5'-nucleotidase [Blyttiomyces sp. JEL0837]
MRLPRSAFTTSLLPYRCQNVARCLSTSTSILPSSPISASEWLRLTNAADHYVKVPQRGVIELEGVESVKFLQGMVTNQMTKVETGGDGILAGFLNAQGRVLYDAFIHPQNKGSIFPHPTFLIDCDIRGIPALMKHLKRYILRSTVVAKDVTDLYTVYQAWGPTAASLWGSYVEPRSAKNAPIGSILPKERFVDVGCKDPRHSDLGIRFLLETGSKVPLPASFSEVDPLAYSLRRILMGIPEGTDDIQTGQSLPLESNFDFMSGVDFRKGCYLGQELTIRTYHTGVTRKRIVPVQIIPSGEEHPSSLTIMPDKNMALPKTGSEIRLEGTEGRRGEVGRFCEGIYNVGLALMRLEHVSSSASGNKHDVSLVSDNGMKVKAFVPEWWPKAPSVSEMDQTTSMVPGDEKQAVTTGKQSPSSQQLSPNAIPVVVETQGQSNQHDDDDVNDSFRTPNTFSSDNLPSAIASPEVDSVNAGPAEQSGLTGKGSTGLASVSQPPPAVIALNVGSINLDADDAQRKMISMLNATPHIKHDRKEQAGSPSHLLSGLFAPPQSAPPVVSVPTADANKGGNIFAWESWTIESVLKTSITMVLMPFLQGMFYGLGEGAARILLRRHFELDVNAPVIPAGTTTQTTTRPPDSGSSGFSFFKRQQQQPASTPITQKALGSNVDIAQEIMTRAVSTLQRTETPTPTTTTTTEAKMQGDEDTCRDQVTKAHKRDAFIEFIKSLLLTPFILHTRPKSARPTSTSLSAADQPSPALLQSLLEGSDAVAQTPGGSIRNLDRTLTDGSLGAIEAPDRDKNVERYCEVLDCVEGLIVDHMLHQNSGLPELSRLSQLVPSIGRFFTPLPLKEAFIAVNKIRSVAARRYVPPSFNDIRHILNMAQVSAIAGAVKLITFDGDMTLYADGADFAHDSELVDLIVGLLRADIHVAIVTAAGYPGDAARYEKRLSGLLDGIRSSDLPHSKQNKFHVLGGECNYLFHYNAVSEHLEYMKEDLYQPVYVKAWSNASDRIAALLDVGEACMSESVEEMGIRDRVKIIRKERALGVISVSTDELRLSREQLDEIALAVQRRLNNYQHAQLVKSGQLFTPLPFCAFNGGSDVWLDIGNKLIGVKILQEFLGANGNETLHVGDQFLSTGNDILTRSCAATVWITSPEETAGVLRALHEKLQQVERKTK